MMQTGWDTFTNLLCVRLDNLGDVLMTSPAIRALKRSVPGRKITLLTSKAGSGIARCIPEIDEIIEFAVPWQGSGATGSSEAVTEMMAMLKSRSFEAAVVFTVYSQNPLPTAMLCYLAGIPRIAGYCRENPYGLMTDWLPDPEPLYQIRHEVTRQLDLVQWLGAEPAGESFSLQISLEARNSALQKLAQKGVDPGKPLLVLHPGVSEAKRQYPVASFAEAARQLCQEMGFQVLLTGVASEKPLAEQIIQTAGTGTVDLTGELNLEELSSVISQCVAVVANNTGPVHIAAAVGTPVVVMYALTNPQHTPWQVPHRVLPFDVPTGLRSKNVIIANAYEKAFVQGDWIQKTCGIQPDKVLQTGKLPEAKDIVRAVRELLPVEAVSNR